MYEGWHILLTEHAKRRMVERFVDLKEIIGVVANPDLVSDDIEYGGKLLSKYLPDWDRILVIAITERARENVLLVKTVLWSKAN
jgi:hypothetical protein